MAESNRKPILDRAVALLAGPFLLGQRALDLTFLPGKAAPPEEPPQEAERRISIMPPEHAITRRG